MEKQSDVWLKLGYSAIVTVVIGAWSWLQYSKYEDGRGIALWLLHPHAHPAALAVIFVVLPLAVSCWVGWGIGKSVGSRGSKPGA